MLASQEVALAFGQHQDRWPTHAYEPTREAAMVVTSLRQHHHVGVSVTNGAEHASVFRRQRIRPRTDGLG